MQPWRVVLMWCAVALLTSSCSRAPGAPPLLAGPTPERSPLPATVAATTFASPPSTAGATSAARSARSWQLPPGLSTFRKALIASGLIDELRDSQSLTVFAPMDEAFQKLPAGAWDAILKDPARLRQVLLYHFVDGLWTTGALSDISSLPSLQGGSLAIAMGEGKQFTVNGAFILFPDFQLKRLVLHRIDTVLMPPP